MSPMKYYKHPEIKAFCHPSKLSDHKIIIGVLKVKNSDPTLTLANSIPPRGAAKCPKFDVDALKNDEETREKYQRALNNNIGRQNVSNRMHVNEKWKALSSAITNAAMSTLQKPPSPMTPRRAKASKDYVRVHQQLLMDRSNSTLKNECEKARREKRMAFEQHFEEKVQNFLE